MTNKSLYTVENFMDASEMNALEKKWIDKMSDLIVSEVFNWNIENNEEFKKVYRNISSGYHLMKQKFCEVARDDWERYFEHLRAVANIVLELPYPNTDKVLIALLHDSIEDTNIDFHTLKILYWVEIAIAVECLSKKDAMTYLNSEEYTEWKDYSHVEFKKLKELWKERRNKEYFWHLQNFESMKKYVLELAVKDNSNLSDEELNVITQNIIDVKLADRIHNLSTQWDENNTDKVIRKVNETKDYFLGIAEETNTDAYNKIKSLLLDLELKLQNFSKRVTDILETKK